MSADPIDRDAAIARAMDTFPEAVPYLAALCADFDGLGTSISEALSMLDAAGATPGIALDCGCGKGAHAVALAERGWRVQGVDLHEPFLTEARQRAADAGVASLCEFVESDLVEKVKRAAPGSLDLAMLIAIGRPWGSLGVTIGALRSAVRAGGWILIDDAYLDGDDPEPPGYEGYSGREETERELTSHGDIIVGRCIPSDESARAQHERELGWLRQRGAELIARDPESIGVVRRFLAMQEGAYEDLVGPARGSAWLLRRSSD